MSDRLKRRVVPLFLIALVSASCTVAGDTEPASRATQLARDLAVVSPESVGLATDRLERLESGMQAFVDDGKLAGVVTLAARHGKIVHFSAAGSKDVETGDPIETDSIFRIYSMTKPVTGVAMMILYEEGKWRLDDPVANYIPAFADVQVYAGDGPNGEPRLEAPASPLTIRQLMTHSGGLSYGSSDHYVDQRYRERGLRHGRLQQEADVFDRRSTLQDMVDELATIPLMVQPGTRWIYSASVDVQGHLVEQLSGQPLADFFHDRIFEPLGMIDTAFYVPEEKLVRLAAVHAVGDDGKLRPGPHGGFGVLDPDPTVAPSLPQGGAGLFSTAEDYARFAQMLANNGELNGERILAPRTVKMMGTSHLSPEAEATMTPGLGFGLDFAVVLDAAAAGVPTPEDSYYWSGAAGTWFWIDPVTDLVFVGMIQHQGQQAIGEIRGLSRNLIYQAIVAD